ncbi:sensor histidine kinase [Saccharicrinis sp. GN24d3]|uniref:sensor histidine kinase n=1 Tax=Saccharicrinis sp. GN24d3 TaxID=3458416 RepID=UPI004036DDCA
MKLRFIHIIFIISMLPPVLSGQHHFFRQYSLEEGLPQSEVNDIAEDKFGYLWLGTNGGGLCRFNGIDFEVMTKKDGLLEDLVMGLYSDNNYDLWIGSPKGVTKYNGKDFKYYIKSDTAIFQDRMQFLEMMDGSLWLMARSVSGNRVIYHFSDQGVRDFTRDNAEVFKDKKIFFMSGSGSKKIMVSTNEGVYEIENGEIKQSDIHKKYGLEDRILIPLLQDKYRNQWVLSFGKENSKQDLLLLALDGKIRNMEWPKEISLDRVFRTYEDRNGGVWIAVASGGIVWFNDNRIKLFNKTNGLKTSLVTSFGEDREGNMWFGTSGSGLFKYGGEKFVSFNQESGLGGNIIRSIFQDRKGNVYMGDDNNTISVFDGEKVELLEASAEADMAQARKMVELKNGHILVATLGGLFEYNKKSFVPVEKKYGLKPRTPVVDMVQNGDTIWMAIYGKGLAKHVSGSKNEWFTPHNSGLTSPFITNLFIDSNQNIWISTTKGVFKYDNESFTHFSDLNQLNSSWVLQSAEDKVGNIWFATFTGGLNRYDGEKFTYFDTSTGVRSDNIYSVIADTEGNIWAGTQNGVDKLTLDQTGELVSIQNFDKDDGFIGIENNGGCNLLDREGRLWFGTIKGAMMYNPDAERPNYLEPPVYLREVLLNFQQPKWDLDSIKAEYDSISPWFSLPQNLSLPYNRSHLSFVFDGLSYTVPEKIKYKWKLEPIEQEWSPDNDFNMAFYPALSPGRYTFKVLACNNDGVWNEEGASYSFEIRPAWYQYSIVRILGILFVVGLVLWFIRMRIAKEKRLKDELEAKLVKNKLEIQKQQAEIKSQTETLVDQKKQLEQQAKSLKDSNKDLERLTSIGQLVTSKLSMDRISELLYQSVSKVMSTDVFLIGMYNAGEKSIDFTHNYLMGERQPFLRYLIEDKERLAVYSFTHDRDILIRDFYNEYKQYVSELRPVPNGEESESAIYIPLKTSHEVIGVISVQSLKKNAYTSYHFNFIKNIANYASIALDNAIKYQSLVQEQKVLQHKHEDVLGEKDVLDKQKQLLEELNVEKSQLFSLFVKGIQEPLNLSIGDIQSFLKKSDNCTEEQRNFLSGMLKILRKQNEVVNKVLEVRNIENDNYTYQPQRFELMPVLQGIVNGLDGEARDKNIRVNISSKKFDVWLDMNLLVKIIENLLSNAIRFSPENTDVQLIAMSDDNNVKIEVHDNGPGLQEEEKEKIFKKYSRLRNMKDDVQPTSGLGLYIVKKYVDVMNGSIRCESVSGFGTSFIVEFPLA